MSTAKKKAKQTVQSTDRGGPILLILGGLILMLGFMTFLGLTLQTSAPSLQLFKEMALGLGGALYALVPLLFIGWGIAISISTKRYVSFYPFIVGTLLFLSVAALVTLLTGVEGHRDLMDFVRNINANYQTSNSPDSMGAYISTAYLRYNGRFAHIPGGGALGMLLAFPFWAALGKVGAITMIILACLALFFALIRVNPVAIAQKLGEGKSGSASAQPAVSPQPRRDINHVPEQAEVYEVPQEAFDIGEPAIAHDPVMYDQQIGVDYPEEPVYPVWPSPAYQPAPAGVQVDDPDTSSFIPQTPADLWMTPDPVPVKTAQTPPVRDVKPATRQQQPEPLAEKPVVQEPAHIAPVVEPVKQPPVMKKPEPMEQKPEAAPAPEPVAEKKPAVSAAKPSDSAKPVLTASAVTPSGERVAIPSRAPLGDKNVRMDGTPKETKPMQVQFAIDSYQPPPMRLLGVPAEINLEDTTEEDQAKANRLIETLSSFAIPASLHHITHGPTVTRFAIRLAEGVNVSKLRSVMDNLTIELKAKGDIRAEIPIPGTSFVGLEVSNDTTSKVYLSEVLDSPRIRENKSPTTVALGKDITGTPILAELMDMPHLLIAGATGSGKSVCINSIICSILYRASPRQVRLILIDPKFVELQPYNDVPHLLLPVISDAKKATMALDWVCQEMDERYQTMQKAGVRNLDAYNKKLGPDEEPIPRIIVIVDEMADLMTVSGKVIEDHIKRITAKARAAGICLILATQRPSVNIITGVIKANIPGRIAFRVASPFDSKTILDAQGAEKLLGYGDMLFRGNVRDPIRVQGCFVSDRDVEQTVGYIKSRNKADYNLDIMEHIEQQEQAENGGLDPGDGGDEGFDDLLPQAIEMAVESGQMSISMLQRVLRVGYARAGRLIDEMARRGVISGNEGTKARKTLMTREQYSAYLEQSDF